MGSQYSPSPGLRVALCLMACTALIGCSKLAARAELKKGNAFYTSGAYRAAVIQYQKGLDLDPKATFAWRSLGLSAMALYRPGDTTPENVQFAELAVNSLDRYLKDYPEDGRGEELLITTLVQAGRYDEALERLEAKASKEPTNAGLLRTVIGVLSQAGRLEEALARAEAQKGTPDPELFVMVGVASWNTAYYDASVDHDRRSQVVDLGMRALEQVLALEPNHMSAMSYINLLYREKAKLELDFEKQDEYLRLAEEWRAKAMAAQAAQAEAEAEAKTEGGGDQPAQDVSDA